MCLGACQTSMIEVFARFLLLSVNYFHKWFIIHICLRKSTHLIMMMIMIVWHCVKSVQIRSFFWSVFLTFGMNTERYFVSLRIHSECGKIWTLFVQWKLIIQNQKKVLFGCFESWIIKSASRQNLLHTDI